MYKLTQTENSKGIAKHNPDGSITYIPFAEGNTDYQAYLKWLKEGNTPEPADQGVE
jgi:hypothetical protein